MCPDEIGVTLSVEKCPSQAAVTFLIPGYDGYTISVQEIQSISKNFQNTLRN